MRSYGPKGTKGMMLIMCKIYFPKFPYKNYPIQAVSGHIRPQQCLWMQTTAALLSMSSVLCFRNSWLRRRHGRYFWL